MENEFEHVLMPSILPTLPTLFDPFWTTTQTPGESNVEAVGFSHWYYAISCILVTFVTAVYFGKADPVHSHVMLAFLSTGLLYFAIFAGMGLGVGIQSRGAPELIFVIPFIGALTGMNNIYMLFSLYSFIKRRDGLDDPKGLVEKVFEKSHARLLISLVLGFLGTIIGCQTAVPLVRFMARTSMCTIWITWFATVIGTGVFLYWDGVREAAGRYDVCPLMKGEVKATPMLPRFDSNVKHLADHSLITEDSHQLEGFFEKFLRRVYIPNFIKAWPLHILVILGFLALWIAGAYLTKQVTNKLSYDQVFAPDSALIRGVNEFPSSYPEVGNGIPIRIPLPVGIDYSNPLVQQQMDYFHYHLQTSPYTTGLLQSWWVAFRAFLVRANQTMGTNPVMFYGQLNIFLGTSPAGNIFGLDLDIRNGTIYKSRIATFAPVYMDLVHDAELYDGLKHDLWNISANYPALNPVYPTSPPFTLYEALLDNNLVKQSQFISALIMVIIAFGLALLYKSWVAIFVGVNIVGAYVIVFGFLNITGYGIGFTRSMVLALATGSCGNSSSIFCFEYQRAPGENGLERCQFAFTIVASYIYHITLVGILVVVILFAESQHLFTEIAVTYYCCVITAAGESFIFLPSIVSFVERIRKMISG